MNAQKRSELNFYWLLLQVLAGRSPINDLISHTVFLDRAQRICNWLARGTSYDPKDMFQDLCLKLLMSGVRLCPDNIPNEKAFFNWLFVLALNMRRDDLRRNGKLRHQEVSLSDILPEALSIIDPGISPEGDCLLSEFAQFSETLPEKTRRALALRQQGITYDKIAEILSRDDAKSMTNVTVRKWVRDSLETFFEGRNKAVDRKPVRKAV
jgi:RNA polymerase sigma factor (sigma-70 family)